MRWLMVTAFVGMVTTCGQKGPLTIPDQQVLNSKHDMHRISMAFPLRRAPHSHIHVLIWPKIDHLQWPVLLGHPPSHKETRTERLFYNSLSWNTLHHLVGHSIVPHAIARAWAQHTEGSEGTE